MSDEQLITPAISDREKKPRKKSTVGQKLREFTDGRDENNLCEFPLASLSDQLPEGQKTLEFSDTLEDWKTKRTLERRVCITGSDQFGLPRPKDEDVLLALLQLTRLANNFQSPEFWFTKHQIIEVLGWKNRGWAYDRIEESLHRWKGVSIHYYNAWRDNANGTWRDSEAVGVIEYFRLTDGRRRSREQEVRSRLIWNKLFFESFQAGYLKKLDFGLYRNLKRPAAKRALRFLDKRFFHGADWEFDLNTFACEKIGLSRDYDTGQLKARLRPALDELEGIGFIHPPRYRKECAGVWKIGISKKQELSANENSATSDLASELTKRGVSQRMANRLVKTHSADVIRVQMNRFDEFVRSHDRRVAKNPAGFLVASIRDNYAVSATPRSTIAQQEKKCQKAATVIPSDESEVEMQDRAKMVQFLNSLNVADRQSFEERALAAANDFQRATLERLKTNGNPMWRALWESLLVTAMRKETIDCSNLATDVGRDS